MFRRILCLILSIIIMLSLFALFGSGESSPRDDNLPDWMMRIFEEQVEAQEAYTALRTLFVVNKDGTVVYPDDYAGAWYNSGKLYIALTSDKPEITSKYRDFLKEFNCIIFEKAQYSLNELNEIRGFMFESLMKDLPIIGHYVNVMENKIVLKFSELNEEDIQKSLYIIIQNIFFDKILNSNLFILEKGEQLKLYSELIGGMEISNSVGNATLGVCGFRRRDGQQGIFTAGHAVPVSGNVDLVLPSSTVRIGAVSHREFSNNGNGDWAFVNNTGTYSTTRKVYGTSTSNTRNMSSTVDDLAVGLSVMSFGMNNGYAISVIQAQNVTANIGGTTVNGLTHATLGTSYSAGPGDSGGPFYAVSPTTGAYSFVGLMCGGSGRQVYFTPYVRFKTDFGVRIN